jgi:hypothetical protein
MCDGPAPSLRLGMSPMSTVDTFSPLVPDADLVAFRRALAAFGPLRTYVEAPLKEGLGKGLTRRHDAALHHYRRHAEAGTVERMDVMAARTNLFRATFCEPGRPFFPGVEALWHHAGFAATAARVTGQPDVAPSMLYANALLPGQELAVHSDTPAYVGHDQTNTPEWLLVVMLRSGLFEAHRVRLGAGVGFFSSPVAGDFLVWSDGPDAPPRAIPARANTGVALDTDLYFHGVSRVGGDDAPAPPARPGDTLTWDEPAERWRLQRGTDEIAAWRWDEVRLSFQWKARCTTPDATTPPPLDLDTITERLVADMRSRGALGPDLPPAPQLAVAMIDHYVRFPTHHVPA